MGNGWFPASIASLIKASTTKSTLRLLSSFRATPLSARSAASSSGSQSIFDSREPISIIQRRVRLLRDGWPYQDLYRELRTTPEGTLDASHAHAVDDIRRQPERHRLRDRQRFSLRGRYISAILRMLDDSTHVVQRNSQVDMHDFAGPLVEEHVVRVPIAEAHYVARDAARCDAAHVAEAHCEPGRRVLMALVECEAQHWPNLPAKRREGFQQEPLPF